MVCANPTREDPVVPVLVMSGTLDHPTPAIKLCKMCPEKVSEKVSGLFSLF